MPTTRGTRVYEHRSSTLSSVESIASSLTREKRNDARQMKQSSFGSRSHADPIGELEIEEQAAAEMLQQLHLPLSPSSVVNQIFPGTQVAIANLSEWVKQGGRTQQYSASRTETSSINRDSSRFVFTVPLTFDEADADSMFHQPFDFMRAISACSASIPYSQSISNVVKPVFHEARLQVLRCRVLDDHDDITTVDTQEEEEEMQIRRLGSWNTTCTNATIGTSYSEVSLDGSLLTQGAFDDDGKPIDVKLIQKALLKQRPGRSRLVKFEYPPVSKLKTFPRPNAEDHGQLFFTEEELDTYQSDRDCMYNADDIEIVAISHSQSDDSEKIVSTAQQDDSSIFPNDNRFGSYVPTPTNRKSKIEQHSFDGQEDEYIYRTGSFSEKAKPRRRTATPAPRRYAEEFDDHTCGRKVKPKIVKQQRLITSVQIFLRERSTGK